MVTKQQEAIEAAAIGIANSWGLSPAESSELLRALQQARQRGTRTYDPERVALLLDIFEWLATISENLGGPEKWLRAAPEGDVSYLSKILSGRFGQLLEVHRELAKHAFFGCSPA